MPPGRDESAGRCAALIRRSRSHATRSAGPASLYAKANDAKDMADALVYLLDRPALRQEMGRQGRARVEKELAWPYEAPKLLAAYNAVFAPGK